MWQLICFSMQEALGPLLKASSAGQEGASVTVLSADGTGRREEDEGNTQATPCCDQPPLRASLKGKQLLRCAMSEVKSCTVMTWCRITKAEVTLTCSRKEEQR